VRRSICQHSSIVSFREKRGKDHTLDESDFKSILTNIGLNFMNNNDLDLANEQTLGQYWKNLMPQMATVMVGRE